MNTSNPLTILGPLKPGETIIETDTRAKTEPRKGQKGKRPARMGNLLVITGPSGVGKGTLVKRLMPRIDKLKYSVSVTTRPMRPGEVEGTSYYFCTSAEFEDMIRQGAFMEHAKFAGNYYGTPRGWVSEELERGVDVILEIEVQGTKQIHSQYPDAVMIFISPPSFDELATRLKERGTESEDKINLRLEKAREELQEKNMFHYEVVNDKLDDAVNNLEHIVYAERCRLPRSRS
ncbi:MAG TPA: guanylate kinase [Candidatus Obscuribacter sp.]|nr:guanylate kinase [Candidatus Obscuribacter sp.]